MNVKNIKFKRVTILLPVIDEYKSLTKTLNILLKNSSREIKQIIIKKLRFYFKVDPNLVELL